MTDEFLDRRINKLRRKLNRRRTTALSRRLQKLETLRAMDPADRPKPVLKTVSVLSGALASAGGLVPVAGPYLKTIGEQIQALPAVRELAARGDDALGERGEEAVDAVEELIAERFGDAGLSDKDIEAYISAFAGLLSKNKG